MKSNWWLIALFLSLLVAVLSPLASVFPDGLERVAEDQGFQEKAQEPYYQLIADYLFPGVGNEALATIMAGLLGTLLVFGLVYGLARLLRLRRSESR